VDSLAFGGFGGRVGIAHLLLSCGADPNIKDNNGHYPKDWALSAKRDLMVKMLSRLIRPSAFGQDPFNCDDPPLHQAMAHGFFSAVTQLLKRKKP
jgi:ankyrin repeat protein